MGSLGYSRVTPAWYSTGQAKATNFIASKIDFLGAIGCQDHSYGG